MPSISREELLRALGRENLILVEVLPREYYERAHLPGAVSIPADEIASLAPSLLPDKRKHRHIWAELHLAGSAAGYSRADHDGIRERSRIRGR